MSVTEQVDDVATVLGRLVARYRGWSAPAWNAPGRIEAAQALAVRLAGLGAEAGVPSPLGEVPLLSRPHGLADQLTVLTGELVAALEAKPDPELAARAIAAARTAFP
jgi:hypothetical protein